MDEQTARKKAQEMVRDWHNASRARRGEGHLVSLLDASELMNAIATALSDAARVGEGKGDTRPHRAYEFTIQVGADTPDDMVWSVEQIARGIAENINTQAVSGGPSSGWILTPNHTPGKTHDQYIAELDAYLKAALAAAAVQNHRPADSTGEEEKHGPSH